MLLWPAVAGVGFLVLAGLVIALGTATTARYKFEQDRLGDPKPATGQEPKQPDAGRRRAAALPFTGATVITVDAEHQSDDHRSERALA